MKAGGIVGALKKEGSKTKWDVNVWFKCMEGGEEFVGNVWW